MTKHRIIFIACSGSAEERIRYQQALAASPSHLVLEWTAMDIPEQSDTDPEERVRAKIRFVMEKIHRPFIICDAALLRPHHSSLPLSMWRSIASFLGPDTAEKIMNEKSLVLRAYIGFWDGTETRIFTGDVQSAIAVPASGDHFIRAYGEFVRAIQALDTSIRHAQEEAASRWDARASAWESFIRDSWSYASYERHYERFLSVLETVIPLCSGDALDIGCGTGETTAAMARLGNLRVLGIDISERMIAEARKRAAAAVRFHAGAIDSVSPDARYALVSTRGILLSHLPKFAVFDFLSEITARADDGCYLVLDYLVNTAQDPFPSSHPKNSFHPAEVRDLLREYGWVRVLSDGTTSSRVCIDVYHKPGKETVYFATGNPRKLQEWQAITAPVGKKFALYAMRLDEIQTEDLEEIVAHKLRQAYAATRMPVVCTDGGIYIEALRGFPGPYSKHAAQKIGANGILKLLAGLRLRAAFRRNSIGYYDGHTFSTTLSEVACRVAEEERSNAHDAYELDTILIPMHADNADRRAYSEMPVAERVRYTELPALHEWITARLSEAGNNG